MATRAENFRSEQERAHAPESPRAERSDKPDKATRLQSELSGTVRNGAAASALRNLSQGKSAAHALEDTIGSAAPSRKSTRRSGKDHLKAATSLTARQLLRTTSPSARHQKRT